MFRKLIIVLLLIDLTLASIQKIPYYRAEPDQETLIRKWESLEKKLGDTIDSVMKQILPSVLRMGSEAELTDQCTDGLTQLIFGLRKNSFWTYQMLDAMGKPSSGILDGSISSLGSYDECINIVSPSDSIDDFTGKYCLLDFKMPLPKKPRFYRFEQELDALRNFTAKTALVNYLKSQAVNFYFIAMRFGVCLPSLCTTNDVEKIAHLVGDNLELTPHVSNCEVKENFHFDTTQIIILSLICGFCALPLLATVVASCRKHPTESYKEKWSICEKIIDAFCIPVSISETLKTKSGSANEKDDHLNFLHGFKFLSITWVMLGHTYLFVNWQLINNLINAKNYSGDFFFQVVLNGTVAVDTFFFITAVLISFLCLKMVKNQGPQAFNIPIYIFHRYWRLIPSTMFVAGLIILLPSLGSGPVWHETIDIFADSCKTNWWSILVVGNNFLHPKDTCLQHTWYIACDLQLFLCAIVFLCLSFRKPIYGRIFVLLLVLVNVVGCGLVTWIMDHPPALLLPNTDVESRQEIWQSNYFLPYSHAGPYGLGLLVGQFLEKRQTIKISKLYQCLGWIIAAALNLSVLYVPYVWNRPDGIPTMSESILYSSLHRTAWGLGLVWLTLTCAYGYGGYINKFLSWRAFIPLSRLTFLIYLIHFLVMWCFVGTRRSTMDASHFLAIICWIGYVCISIGIAFILRIFIERPLQELEGIAIKAIFRKKILESTVDGEDNGPKWNSAVETVHLSSIRHTNGINL